MGKGSGVSDICRNFSHDRRSEGGAAPAGHDGHLRVPHASLGSVRPVTETQYAKVNGLDIAYETFGDPADRPIVLIMGLGTQMIAWPDDFCEALADAGHYVVRFDNRDIGLSTHLKDAPKPSPLKVALKREAPAYTLEDLADDTTGLLDVLGLGSVDLVGASMGSYIAQTVALRSPERVRRLTLIMTTTGSRRVGQPAPQLWAQLLKRRNVKSREDAVNFSVSTFRLIGSPGFPFDEEHFATIAGRSYDRGYNPAGYFRQLGAVVAQGNRTKRLKKLNVPTLVLHGLADKLVPPSGGMAVAKAVPGAKFVGFSGMGHDLPRQLRPQFVTEITTHSRLPEVTYST
jgi:pimeloyl-ACP methyl ester carboxylesterase